MMINMKARTRGGRVTDRKGSKSDGRIVEKT
jgi:hypothetical protein